MPQGRRFSVAGQWINDGSLPPEWEELVEPETGKSYFVDHVLKITSWVDPRDLFMKPEQFVDCADGGLALGWERVVDNIHGEYFVDHNTWTTTFTDPRVPPSLRTKAALVTRDLLNDSMNTSIGPASTAGQSRGVSMAGEQDEMLENMSKYISHNEERSQRLQDRVNELEDELHASRIDATSSSSKYGSPVDISSTNHKANTSFQKQVYNGFDNNPSTTKRGSGAGNQVEVAPGLDTVGKRDWADNLQTFVSQEQTEISRATKGINSRAAELSKANLAVLENETTVQRRPKSNAGRRSNSPRRPRSRYASESGASEAEFEAMTAEMDRLEDMKRHHQSRITELRSRSKSGTDSSSSRAKLLAAAGQLSNATSAAIGGTQHL